MMPRIGSFDLSIKKHESALMEASEVPFVLPMSLSGLVPPKAELPAWRLRILGSGIAPLRESRAQKGGFVEGD
jgi:hypothetical protein